MAEPKCPECGNNRFAYTEISQKTAVLPLDRFVYHIINKVTIYVTVWYEIEGQTRHLILFKQLKDHQKLITKVIDKLEAIIEVVEKHEETVMGLYGDTHLIQIWGEKEVMNKLIKRQLVEKEKSM